MAATARLGMEIQPKLLSDSEKQYVRGYLAAYKQFRDIVFDGDLYRVSSPYEGGYYALAYVAKDKSRAVFFAFCLDYEGRSVVPKFRIRGLDTGARYQVSEVAPSGSPRYWGDGKVLGGDYLSSFGVNMNLKQPFQSAVLLLERQ